LPQRHKENPLVNNYLCVFVSLWLKIFFIKYKTFKIRHLIKRMPRSNIRCNSRICFRR